MKDMAGPNNIHSGDERTPLLGAPETAGDARAEVEYLTSSNGDTTKANGHAPENNNSDASKIDDDEDKPLPIIQVLLICFVSLQDPIVYFSIFPFINEMIERTGDIRPEDVGFWSGAIESMFSLAQMLLMLPYGRLADRIGRKPVLVFTLAGVSVASGLFGMSKTLWQMILLRCCAGIFSGSVVTMKVMMTENSTKKTQAKAFSWYMFSRNLGILVGPVIGGTLADPAQQYPKTFGNSPFLKQYPYALASFATGAVGLAMTLTALFALKETLVRNTNGTQGADKPMSTWEVLKTPGVPTVLWIYNHVLLLSLSYTAVSTVFMYTPVRLGGFSFTPPQISIFLAVAGASQASWMLLAFPLLQPRFGTGWVLRLTTSFFPVFLAMYPLLNEFLRHGFTKAFWIVGLGNLIIGSGISMSFACVQLCLNDISPSPSVNGTLNALALAITSGIRATVPAIFTSIFATGVKLRWIDGHLVWVCLIALALPLVVAVRYLPEKADGQIENTTPDENAGEEGD